MQKQPFIVALIVLVTACSSDSESISAQRDFSQSEATIESGHNCGSLVGRTFADVEIHSAEVKSGSAISSGFCELTATEIGTSGITAHELNLLLPDNWSGRYFQQGGAGFDGVIRPLSGDAETALQNGAAVLRNNGGHNDPTGASFLNKPDVIERYAHTAIGTGMNFAKAVLETYYGRSPQYSYYGGCSNGGRGALNAAAKYGSEFDGVIAAAPGISLTGLVQRWTTASALTLPTADKMSAVHQAAIKKCDAYDGADDGIISNWQACRMDVKTDLADIELGDLETKALVSLYSDLTLNDGQIIYSAFGTGDLAAWAARHGQLGLGHMRYIVLSDADWSAADFDINSYQAKIHAVLEDKFHFSPEFEELVRYLESGKKILLWHGSGDTLLSHHNTIRHWDMVASSAGPAAAANSILYVAPGVNHCSGGEGADTFDLITPLIQWVENGKSPEAITAARLDENGNEELTRPLCEYPAYPKYSGNGTVADARNFHCTTP